jgi:hypothetical protein
MSKLTSRDFFPNGDGFGTRAGHVRTVAAPDTPDAELYRIVVAHAIREGRFHAKADYDSAVRSLGTVDRADEIIAYWNLRPECKAYQIGERMMCECGNVWKVDRIEPLPHCRTLPA